MFVFIWVLSLLCSVFVLSSTTEIAFQVLVPERVPGGASCYWDVFFNSAPDQSGSWPETSLSSTRIFYYFLKLSTTKMLKFGFSNFTQSTYCCHAWPNFQNGPNRRIHVPKCGLLTNCIYNWVCDKEIFVLKIVWRKSIASFHCLTQAV